MKHLIIIGVGGFAREVYWYAQESLGYGEDWDIKGFLDGDVKLASEEYEKLDLPVLGNVATYAIEADDVFTCAIGDGEIRKKLTDTIRARGGEFINVIHKTARIQGHVQMGIGNILAAHTHLHDHVVVGDFNIFNVGSGSGHDGRIGSYVSFMGASGLCGFASAGDFSYWATGALALPHAVVEDHVNLGVGTVVFKRAKAGRHMFGNPAYPID